MALNDRAGNELAVGEKVLFLKPGTSTSWLIWGDVLGFTPKMIRILYRERGHAYTCLRNPESVVKPFRSNGE